MTCKIDELNYLLILQDELRIITQFLMPSQHKRPLNAAGCQKLRVHRWKTSRISGENPQEMSPD